MLALLAVAQILAQDPNVVLERKVAQAALAWGIRAPVVVQLSQQQLAVNAPQADTWAMVSGCVPVPGFVPEPDCYPKLYAQSYLVSAPEAVLEWIAYHELAHIVRRDDVVWHKLSPKQQEKEHDRIEWMVRLKLGKRRYREVIFAAREYATWRERHTKSRR